MYSLLRSSLLVGLVGVGGVACLHDEDADPVRISGTVTFDRVPSVPGMSGGGLDYAGTQSAPARGVTVEFIASGSVTATTTTDAAGGYSFTVPGDRRGFLRVKAEMVQAGSPSWDFRVLDNTNGDALYALDGSSFNSGTSDSTRDLHADSGWGGFRYSGERAAAPFAVLDVVYDAVELVLANDSALAFPALTLHWSPDNVPVGGSGGVDPATGEIVTTFFWPSESAIYVLGAEDVDTDEYDRHVLLHEWGHYFEHAFSRSDSFGGPHARGDLLDLRLAFGEGFGNAFSAIVSGDSVYRDVLGPAQAAAPAFDVEGPLPLQPNPAPGWYSEESIQELIYDLVDADDDGADALTLGFGPIYEALTTTQRDGIALTSIFPLIHALVSNDPGLAAPIDALLSAQSIAPVADVYGSTETNDAGDPRDVLPIYTEVTVNAGAPVNVCSTDAFRSNVTGMTNKLGSRRYLRFSLAADADVTITAAATAIPAGEHADPDLVLHRAGTLLVSEASPDVGCVDTSAPTWIPQNCVESTTTPLTAADYVLEVYEWTNTLADDDATPPIGRTCFDVTVTVP